MRETIATLRKKLVASGDEVRALKDQLYEEGNKAKKYAKKLSEEIIDLERFRDHLIEGMRHYQTQRDSLIGFCEAGRSDRIPEYLKPFDNHGPQPPKDTYLDLFLSRVKMDYHGFSPQDHRDEYLR